MRTWDFDKKNTHNDSSSNRQKADDAKIIGGLFNGITDSVIDKIMDRLDIEKKHIEKAKEILSMIEFKNTEDKKYAIVQIGDNIEVKITL